jgi:hypothetical protein
MSDNNVVSQAFQTFVEEDLAPALNRFDCEEAAVYIYCHPTKPTEPSRRVLVVTEANSAMITVCIEAAYQLFEGDIHHYVRRIGMIPCAEAAGKLRPLLWEAYEIVMSWKPTFADIEDILFLPS